MQFVAHGPDIPNALLQAHEQGRVVFFCGAGISRAAGLPEFQGLVDEIYRLVHATPDDIEQKAYDRGQFDATLDLLERRLPGARSKVRRAVARALQPNLHRKGAADTHIALLQLAHSREGAIRLVTTNFDRIFERVNRRMKLAVNTYPAPQLPIPRNSRWNGLVYLHGLLPKHPEDSMLNRLVLTSGDFGTAYLTERWAARFVSELFRNYIVCFVGYGINDPVLRYMMDALAADRMQGEITPQAYAFGDCSPPDERSKSLEWEAKGVIPILYQVPAGDKKHSVLHGTLRAWAETYSQGTRGKESIVVGNAMARPTESTQQDDFVGRMLWALSDETGLPARRFAEFEPAPALEWLEAFSEERYHHHDLGRFGVQPNQKVDSKLTFCLVHRPAPYSRAPWMRFVMAGHMSSRWDEIMFQLGRWLVRHLDDPALIHWLAKYGGQLHDQMISLIEDELDRIARIERENDSDELERIAAKSPRAIPRPVLRPIWHLLLSNRVKSHSSDLNLYRWKDRLMRHGLTTTLRLQLRDLLSPKITLAKPIPWLGDEPATETPTLRQIIDWDLVLAADHVRSALTDIARSDVWCRALPTLLGDFQLLLRDALDLLRELEEGDARNDRSHWDLPSISKHRQNRGHRDWVALIELTRDAWITVRATEPGRATQIAQAWFALPYPTFKRLALFAASQNSCITPDEWVGWLLADEAWCLWSSIVQRETARLLVLQGIHLGVRARRRLEAAILTGPPRSMFWKDGSEERFNEFVTLSIWLQLARLHSAGVKLGRTAANRMNAISQANPTWELAKDERDEFSYWMVSSSDPDFEDDQKTDLTPRKRNELVVWLRKPPASRLPFHQDTWRETCRSRFFHSAFALCDLTLEGYWPSQRWAEALQVWREEGQVVRSWRFIAPLVLTMPDEVLQEIASSFTSWLEVVAKGLDRHTEVFLKLCRRILTLPDWESVATYEPVSHAINHPVGQVTQALLTLWFRRRPNDGDGLPADLKPLFTELCDTRVAHFRHARVLLASRLVALFRVDRPWTEANLLPLLDWTVDASEAQAAWNGFLWSPRLYDPLLIAFKAQFLETARHYAELREHSDQFAAFLTYAALEPVNTYTARDFQAALHALPEEGLRESAQALIQALEGAGEQREEYWLNRIQPFWQSIWPKSRHLASNGIAETLARLSIVSRGQFPAALKAVIDWLQPIEHPHFVVHLLNKSNLSERFPKDALGLLDAIIVDQPWPTKELGSCLSDILKSAPSLWQDVRYQRLHEYFRRRGE